jgi:hypothetical protein
MPRVIKALIGMSRLAQAWERAYFAVLIAAIALAFLLTPTGVQRFIVSFLALLIILMVAGSFFIIDNLRTRWDHVKK